MLPLVVLLLLFCEVSSRKISIIGAPSAPRSNRKLKTLTGVKVPYTVDLDYYTLPTKWVKQWHEIVNFGADHGKRYPQIDEYPTGRRLHVRLATKSPKNWNNGCDPVKILKNNVKYHIWVVIEPTFMTVYYKEGTGPVMLGCIQTYKQPDIPSSFPVYSMTKQNGKGYPAIPNGKIGALSYSDGANHPTVPAVPKAGIPFKLDPKVQCGKSPWNPAFPKLAVPIGTYEMIPTGGSLSWWSSGSTNWDWGAYIAFPNKKAMGARLPKRGTQSWAAAAALKEDFQFSVTSPGMYFWIPDYPCTDNRGAVTFKIVPVKCHRSPNIPGATWVKKPAVPANLGDTAQLKCKAGYTPNPANGVTTCGKGAGGKGWSPISCKPSPCGALPTSLGTNAVTTKCPKTFVHGTSCPVSCPAGYDAAFTSLVCRLGKFNTGGKPLCHKKSPADCKGSPADVPNGDWEACASVASGSTCPLDCATGFTLSGGNAAGALCTNGKYDPSTIPTCKADDCGPAPQVWKGSYQPACTAVASGTTCTFKCNPGYSVITTAKPLGADTVQIKCTNGNWDQAELKCQPKRCTGPAPLPTGATWKAGACPNSNSGDVCEFECTNPNQMPHQDVECEQGNWQPAKCVDAPVWRCDCQAPGDVPSLYGPKCSSALATDPIRNFILNEAQLTFEHEFGPGNVNRYPTRSPPTVESSDLKWLCVPYKP